MACACVQALVLMAFLGFAIGDKKLTHSRYVHRLITAISEYLLLGLLARVADSPFFGLLIDLSTDRANREIALLYVVYWDWRSMAPVTEYLCLGRLLGKDAESIFNFLQAVCGALDLDLQQGCKIFTADGDNTMQGWRTGLVGRLRRFCDFLFAVHCGAHRTVLCCKEAGENSLVVAVDKAFTAAHKLFSRKPKHFAIWERFAKSWRLTRVKFPLFNTTRWFSRETCISMLISCLVIFMTFLRGMSTFSKAWEPASPMLAMLMRKEVLVVLFLLADIFAAIAVCRKVFERDGCNLQRLKGQVTQCRLQLQSLWQDKSSLAELGGKNMDALRKMCPDLSMPGVSKLQGSTHTVNLDSAALPDDMHERCVALLKSIDAEMADRFPADELQLASLFKIFTYEFYQNKSMRELEKAGEKELEQMLEILSRKAVTSSGFYCRQPLIDASDPDVKRDVFAQFRCVRRSLVTEVRHCDVPSCHLLVVILIGVRQSSAIAVFYWLWPLSSLHVLGVLSHAPINAFLAGIQCHGWHIQCLGVARADEGPRAARNLVHPAVDDPWRDGAHSVS